MLLFLSKSAPFHARAVATCRRRGRDRCRRPTERRIRTFPAL